MRGSSSEKVRQWTQCLKRFEKAQLTVKQFCKDEGASQSSFYHWKKKLGEQTLQNQDRQHQLRPARFVPVRIVSTVAEQIPKESIRQGATVHLGQGIRIELGGDLRVVESVVRQLVAASSQAESAEHPPC